VGRPAAFLWAAFAGALGAPAVLWMPWVRDRLGDDRATIATFSAVAALPAMLSLLWAYLSDRWPLFGSRRQGYLLLACAILVPALRTAPRGREAVGMVLLLTVAPATSSALTSLLAVIVPLPVPTLAVLAAAGSVLAALVVARLPAAVLR
jgi:hypothetical protein